jgi:hypothetical protein
MWKEKLGNYLIDISKYVFTGVIVSSFFKDFGENVIILYGLGTLISILTLVFGLVLTNKKKDK